MAALTVRTALLAAVPVLIAGAVGPDPPAAPLAVAALLALLFVLGAAGLRLAALLLPPGEHGSTAHGPTRWSAAAVFATALATLPATLLGHVGLLRPGAFLLWTAALAVLAALTPARAPRAIEAEPPPASRWRTVERLVAVAVLAILALSVLSRMREDRYAPPGTYGFDDLSYHLSTVATWLDTGDLSMIRFDYGDPSTPFYPIVGELVAWVLMAPFRDLDLAARWAQLPFALATLAALLALARRIGLRPAHALPALALFASLQRVFPFTALAAGNDHAASFFTLAALDGVLAAARRRTVGTGLYAGTALGLLVGTKYLGLLFVPPVLAVGAVAWWAGRADPDREADRGRARGRTLAAATVAAGAAVLTGGYTYLRNWATTGNPLFPSPVRLAGIELFPGWEAASLAWRRGLPEAAIDLPELLFRSDLWGTVPPWLLVSAALVAPLVALAPAFRAAPGDRRWALESAVLLLPVTLFAVFVLVVPDHRDVRYVLPAIGLAALAWCHLAGRLGPPNGESGEAAGSVLRLAAYGAATASLFEWRQAFPGEIVGWCAAGLALGVVVTLWPPARRIATLPRRYPGRAALAAALLLHLPLVSVAETYPERKLEDRLLPRWLDEEAGTPAGTPVTVAYVGFNTPYLYWGSRLRNRVMVVPVNASMEARLYDWGTPTESPYRRGSFRAWRRNLDALGVDHVVVVRAGGEDPVRQWMSDRPEAFERVTELGETEIWRVLRPRSPDP